MELRKRQKVLPFFGFNASTFFCFLPSGSAGPAEVALQHQPAAAEPPSADEGGRRRGGQGESDAS